MNILYSDENIHFQLSKEHTQVKLSTAVSEILRLFRDSSLKH